MAFPNFFYKAKQERQGEEENFQGREHAVPPEVPQRAEQGAEDAEKQNCASQSTQHHIHPQLPVPKGEGEVKQSSQHRSGIESIQDSAAPLAQHQAEGADQVIEKTQQQTQKNGGQKGGELLGDIDAHQPNSRPNSRDLP